MLELQMQILSAWYAAGNHLRRKLTDSYDNDRGEVTAQTAMIFLLVVAAIAAGGVIATKITANANNVPSP